MPDWIQTIQFSISTQFSSIWPIDRTPYQVIPLQASVDLGVMAMKGYSTFSKAPPLLEPHHQIVLCPIQDTRWGGVGSYPSAEKQSVYFTAPANWAIETWSQKNCDQKKPYFPENIWTTSSFHWQIPFTAKTIQDKTMKFGMCM